MIHRGLVLALVFSLAVTAEAVDVPTEAYRTAATAGATGVVTGRVFEERRQPQGPERPIEGVAVTLLPRSEEFLRRLQEVKTRARDSVAAYRTSAPAILALKDAYEKALWEAGAADLVRATAVDAEGRFVIGEVPAGQWVLIATHSVGVERPEGEAGPRRRGTYTPGTRLAGFRMVAVWMREISVVPGRSEIVELMDRNVWHSGVVEERVPGTGR